MWCRGIRGATTVDTNTKDDILIRTRELLQQMIAVNAIEKDNVAYALFTATPDLNAEFPAVAARQLGWHDVALLCGQEIDVSDSLAKCLRILILYNTEKSAHEIIHTYIRGAADLRPDVANSNSK